MNVYTGGIPALNTRRQRGGGFFSALKRFLIPVARTALPHVVGAVGDVLSGQSVGDTLKSRGMSAGADVLHSVADTLLPHQAPTAGAATHAPKERPKKYKRKAPAQKTSLKRSNKKPKHTWN